MICVQFDLSAMLICIYSWFPALASLLYSNLHHQALDLHKMCAVYVPHMCSSQRGSYAYETLTSMLICQEVELRGHIEGAAVNIDEALLDHLLLTLSCVVCNSYMD